MEGARALGAGFWRVLTATCCRARSPPSWSRSPSASRRPSSPRRRCRSSASASTRPRPSWGQMVGREPAVPPLLLVPLRVPVDRHRGDHALVHLLRRRGPRRARSQAEVTHRRTSMRIPDEQLDLFAKRLQAIGVGRRDFLKVVGAMAAFGGLGFATDGPGGQAEQARRPARSWPRSRCFRYGGGGWFQNDPASHDFNKDLYCSGVPALFAGLMVFNADFVVGAVDGDQGRGQQGRLGVDVHDPEGLAAGRTTRPVSARDFEWSWKRQLDPGERGALRLVPLRHQERRGVQQEADHRREPGRGARQGRLDARGDARGAARLLPGARRLPGRAARLPSARWRSTATSGRRPATSSATGRSRSRRGSTTSRSCCKKNPHYFGAKDVHLTRVVIPIIPVASGALPYENNELDMTALQSGDLKRLQSDPRMSQGRLPLSVPRHLVPAARR